MSKQIQINIKKEYFDIVPRPIDSEYKSLMESMREDGQHIPIVVNQEGTILDGHTRYEICKELNIQPIYEIKKFDDKVDEKNYVIITNLSRRNLNLAQRAELLFEWWTHEKEKSYRLAGKRRSRTVHSGGGRRSKNTHGQLANKLGKMIGCGHTSAWKITSLLQRADKTILMQLREGEITIAEAYNKTFGIVAISNAIKYPKSNELHTKIRHQFCLSCGEKTKVVDKKECHVHGRICCTKCEWGI